MSRIGTCEPSCSVLLVLRGSWFCWVVSQLSTHVHSQPPVGEFSQALWKMLRCCSHPHSHLKRGHPAGPHCPGAARGAPTSPLFNIQACTNCATGGELKRVVAFQILPPRTLETRRSVRILKSTFSILLKWQIKSCVWLSLIFLSCDFRQVASHPDFGSRCALTGFGHPVQKCCVPCLGRHVCGTPKK